MTNLKQLELIKINCNRKIEKVQKNLEKLESISIKCRYNLI